jgi:metal-sulfur cluster biosynthetic enzyme
MPSLFQRLSSLWKKPQPVVSPSPRTIPVEQNIPTTPQTPVAGQVQFLNEELVYTVLRTCYDPEIPLNIVDLGLIYGVQIEGERVAVKMTLTTQGCGMGGYISRDVEEKILSLPGVQEARVELVWDPPWTPEMISPEGRTTLGLPG